MQAEVAIVLALQLLVAVVFASGGGSCLCKLRWQLSLQLCGVVVFAAEVTAAHKEARSRPLGGVWLVDAPPTQKLCPGGAQGRPLRTPAPTLKVTTDLLLLLHITMMFSN